MRVALLGLGLIGGSIARSLRRDVGERADGPWSVVAWSPSGEGPAAALADGVIDAAAATPESAIGGADLVVLAGPAPVVLDCLDELAGAWREALAADAVITDVASTKAAIVLRATALGLRFVGGHPMAGREASGYSASSADLFVDRPWVVVPCGDEAADERVERLAVAAGARVQRMSATTHDEAVAAISHLPLVVAAALVETVAGDGHDAPRDGWPAAAGLAASGWWDTTRLARGDVDMGAGIITTNAPAIATRLRDLVAVLEDWLTDLERPGDPDADHIARRLADARARLEATPRR
jgi:prephenate dehydrogenase